MNFLDKIKIFKQHWSENKYFFYSLFGRDLPLFSMIFQVTNVCNSRCLMCFNWQVVNQATDELSLVEIEKLSKTIGRLPVITLGGGEPFLRQDLPEICEIFFMNAGTRKVAIPTNCLLPELVVSQARKIIEKCDIKLKIIMSLDGLNEVHDEIRGVNGNFEKFLATYEAVRQLAAEDKHLQFSVNTTISSRTESTVAEIIEFVDGLSDIKYHTLETIRGSFDSCRVSTPTLAQYDELYSGELLKSKTLARDGVHMLFYAYYHKLALRTLKQKKQIIPCRASSFLPVIDAMGNVYNCELLPSIGNLRDVDLDFMKIWHSKEAHLQRKTIAAKKCHCTHYCYQLPNIMMSPYHFIKAIFFG
jgi:MoaA/NifB/PqqE/SkfB family radical SAM enzyme